VLTSTDAQGNTTAYAYNAFNQAWCSVDAAEYANGVGCPSSVPSSPPSPGATDPNLGATINYYNASDQLTAMTDALGNTTTYAYTSGVSGVPNGLLYCSVDPVSYQHSITCPTYDSSHVTGTTTSTFDSAGDTLTSTNADGDTTTYIYSAAGHPGLVSSQTDPDGTVTTFTYDGAGQVTSQVLTFDSYSATTLYAYDSFWRQYCSVAPAEVALGVACPSSPPSSPPTPGSDPYLGATITTYNANGQVVQVTNPLGGISYEAYDEVGEAYCSVTPSQAALGVTCPSTAPSSPPTIGSDSYLGTTITTYNANGQVVQVTNPLGGITLTDYDGAGNVLQTTVESNNVTLAPNIVTNYTYDSDNRVVSTTVDSGTSLAATTLENYDPNGDVYCIVSANAYASGNYQCAPWQAAWIIAPPSPSTLYSSTPTSAQANNVTMSFDNANGNTVQSTNPDVQTSISAVDGDGRTYCTSDPVNVASWLTANSSGTYPYLCPTSPPSTAPGTGSDPGYVTTIYDAAGKSVSTTNQLGDTTAYTYDAAGNVLLTTNPRGEVTTNCYYDENGSGACAHAAPAAGGSGDDLYSTTTPVTSADPSGEITTYTYFPGGASDTVTPPAATVTDAYNAMGGLLSTTYSGVSSGYTTPTTTSDTYNVDGTVHSMTDASGTTTYGYDAMGDVTSQALVAAGGSGLANATTSYTYFTTGVLATLTYPAYAGHSDPVVTHAYDATGAMISSTDWLGNEVTYAHDYNGNETSQDNAVSGTYPSGTSSTAFTYDAADNNTAATSTLNQSCGSSETLTQSFSGSTGSRNANGQLTEYTTAYSATCSGQTGYERNYSYDEAGDVIYQGSAAQGSSANDLAYDASGDPTTISSHSGSALDTYTQNFDAAVEVTGQSPISGSGGATSTYTYDTLGDQVKDVSTTTTTYAFNAAGQMVSATPTSGTTTYLYSGIGLEAAATSPGTAAPFWNNPVDINSTRAFDVVDCLSSAFCVAVGASGYATIYNGTAWSTPSDVDSTRTMDALDCASTTFCVAVDTSGYATIYNGSTWSTPNDIDSTRSVDAVSCTGSTFCVAVGASGYAAIYNGSWAASSDVDSTRTIDAVSCTSSTFCVTGDTSGYSAKYTGSWTTATDIDSSRSISTIACTSTTFCVTGDTSGYSAKYTGSWATATDIDSSRSIKQVVCESSTFCVTIGSAGYAATYTGSWATATDVDGSTALESISCVSTTYCVTSDGAGNVLTYSGTWGSAKSIDAMRTLASVSCPTTAFCAAVDASGYAILYAQIPPPSPITAQFTWDTRGSLSQILSDATYDYIFGPANTPVEEISLTNSTPAFMTYTPTDSTWFTTNAAGDELGFYGYDAFGSLAFGTPDSTFGYSGQYADTTSGFANMRARFYDSQTGDFTSRDPAFADTDSAYNYADGDPVNETDPSGDWTHGYCDSEQASSFAPVSGGLRFVSQDAFVCGVVDGHGNVAIVTSSSFVNSSASSPAEIAEDWLSSGVASASISTYAFNTNANTVFGGLSGTWQEASLGVNISGFVGASSSLVYNQVTNGSGVLYGGSIGAGVLELPVTFSYGEFSLNSHAIHSAALKTAIESAISFEDIIFGESARVGTSGVPGWFLSQFIPLGGQYWAPGQFGSSHTGTITTAIETGTGSTCSAA
jgi:RHS repeat-associated protein